MRWITVIAVLLVAVVSCNDDPTSIVINQPTHTDTLVVFHTDTVVTFHTDTVTQIVTDTLMVYCWQVDNPNHNDHEPWFECDNGTRGPR